MMSFQVFQHLWRVSGYYELCIVFIYFLVFKYIYYINE